MKDLFSGFYRLSDEEFDNLWRACTFVFDANVLLNVYRYPQLARETLIKIFSSLQDRIWIPHQVAIEYHFNMLKEIKEQEKAYDKLKNLIEEKLNDIEETYKKFSLRHTNLKMDEALLEKVKESVQKICEDLMNQKENHPNLVDFQLRIAELFKGKVGAPYDQKRIDEINDQGKVRYELKIPPGFKDTKKKETRHHDGVTYDTQYGDLIMWFQILDYAKEKNTPILLVTDDQKADWWWEFQGEKIGPHPELVQEFKRETNGLSFYMYQTKQFLKFVHRYLSHEFSEDDINKAIESIDNYKKSVEIEKIEEVPAYTGPIRMKPRVRPMFTLHNEILPERIWLLKIKNNSSPYTTAFVMGRINLLIRKLFESDLVKIQMLRDENIISFLVRTPDKEVDNELIENLLKDELEQMNFELVSFTEIKVKKL